MTKQETWNKNKRIMVIKTPSFFNCSLLTKKAKMYSINPLKINKNGKDTLNPSLIGKLLLAKISNEVVKIAQLDIITTLSALSVRSMRMAIFAIKAKPPKDKLKDFI